MSKSFAIYPSPLEAAAVRIVAVKANEETIVKLRRDVEAARSSGELEGEHVATYDAVVRDLICIIEEANVALRA